MKFKVSFWLLFFLSVCGAFEIDVPALLISCAVHEAGHLAALYALGGCVREVRADLKGIEFKMAKRGCFKRRDIVLINAAGPLAGLFFALAAYFLHKKDLSGLNLIISLFNLLPFDGLDGGDILREIKNTADT